jgi:pyruvate kinase
MKKTMLKTKIICTIGPVSRNETILRKMMLCGMDVGRLNFSHGSHPEHLKCIEIIRRLNKKFRRHIRILQDLEGYRIRIGELKGKSGIPLKKRQRLFLTNKKIIGEGANIPFDYEGDLKEIKTGRHIFIDDGYIALLVKKSSAKLLETEVLVPGVLKEHKGVNIPDVNLKFKGLTDKDKTDIHFGIRHEVDYIAQSFIRDASDILPIRRMIREELPECKIIAKIENRQGIKNIDEIIEASDGIMIARGDMGVSIPIYRTL